VSYFLLGLAVLAAILVLGRWFTNASPRQLTDAVRWSGLVISGVLTGFFFLTGRVVLALPLFLVFLYILIRSLGMRLPAGPVRSGGKQSTVQTEYLDMILDHASGQMAGRVRKGPFEGRDLSDMRPEELMALWRECAARDEQSGRVMESYLDRHHEGWREAAQAQDEAPRRAGPMTPDEARELLGVGPKATEKDIRNAHRKLMRTHHPDQGGSSEEAARLNQARDVLLGG